MDTEDKHLAALESAFAAADSDEDRVTALNALALEQWAHGLLGSLATAEQARRLASEIGVPRALARSLCTEGYLCYRQSKGERAQERLEQALALIQETADLPLEAECRHFLGLVRYSASEFESALAQFLQAQGLYQQISDPVGLAQVLNDMGNLYSNMDDSARALSSYLDSLARRRANGDRRGVACSLNNIGNIYEDMGDYEQAVLSYQQCLATARGTGYVRLEMRCLSNLSLVYADQSRWAEAFETSGEALRLARSGGHRDNECLALISQAKAYQASGRPECAVPQYQEALVIAQELAERRTECEIEAALGECFLALGQIPEAQAALDRAAQSAGVLEMKPIVFRVCLGLSEVHRRQGSFAPALEFYQKFHAVQQEVFSARSENRTKTLLIQMQVEQVRKDAEIHRLRSVELAQANAALEAANRTLQTQTEQLEAQAEELQAQAEELERQATEDGLTGLANRRHLGAWLARQFHQTRHSRLPLTVVMADIDHFKQINDRFGHQVGDEVLMTVALLLRQVCRASDLAARYGGEEFVLALPGTNALLAQSICERIRRAVQDHQWQAIHPDLSVTISLGLSDDCEAASHERLLELADAQLYAAKRTGRNCVSQTENRVIFSGIVV